MITLEEVEAIKQLAAEKANAAVALERAQIQFSFIENRLANYLNHISNHVNNSIADYVDPVESNETKEEELEYYEIPEDSI